MKGYRSWQRQWTDAELKLVERMWAEGASAGEISKKLGGHFSRSAVIGVANRRGFARGGDRAGTVEERFEKAVELIAEDDVPLVAAAKSAGLVYPTFKQMWTKLLVWAGEV